MDVTVKILKGGSPFRMGKKGADVAVKRHTIKCYPQCSSNIRNSHCEDILTLIFITTSYYDTTTTPFSLLNACKTPGFYGLLWG